jgi:protein-S-isoprenylcysteine O-methyltransferase Ste14
MAMIHELERRGNWLFKNRGWLPVLVFIPALALIYFGDKTVYNYNLTEEMIFLGVSLFGQVIRAITIGRTPRGTSGRNVKGQKAHELNVSGIYSTVRHPLYLGNFFMFLGPVLFVRSVWFTLLFGLAYWIYYERIMFAEEQFLRVKFGDKYDKWSEKVGSFIPRFKYYQRATLPYSFRNVLKREYNGFGNIFFTFGLLDFVRNISLYGEYRLTEIWQWLLISGAIVWLVLRTLRKKTKLLNVKGR